MLVGKIQWRGLLMMWDRGETCREMSGAELQCTSKGTLAGAQKGGPGVLVQVKGNGRGWWDLGEVLVCYHFNAF